MCTNFKMKRATDGTVVVGRSMEFPVGVPWSMGVLPVGYAGKGAAPQSQSASVEWTAKYGVVGMAAFGNPQWMADGMNSAGVSIHALYMPNGCCVYAPYKGGGTDLCEVDVITYLLGTCGSVAEVKAAAQEMNVWGMDPGLGFAPPLHFLVHDVEASLAIEFHESGIQIVDNPTGVGTNAPYLDWHLTNLNNYVGIQRTDPESVKTLGETLTPFDTGNGLRGLPGDYSGAARFVRAAVLVALSDEPTDAHAAEMQTLHVLNAFDIPPGLIRMKDGDTLLDEITVWITINNLTDKRYAHRTAGDPTVRVVELADIDFTRAARCVDLSWNADFVPLSL